MSRLLDVVTKAGKTPIGKAVEHALVTGVAVGVSLIVKRSTTGTLSLNDLSAALTLTGAATLAALREALKQWQKGRFPGV